MALQLSSVLRLRLPSKVAVAFVPFFLAGCLSMQPVDRLTPKVGDEVAVDLTDAGRSALAPTLGREVAQVHGNLVRHDRDQDVLSVTSAEFIRGGSQTWAGETVHVHSDFASQYYARRVSTKRSLVVGALVVGAITVMTIEGLNTPAADPSSGGGIEQPGDKLRAPHRPRLTVSTRSINASRVLRSVIPLFARH